MTRSYLWCLSVLLVLTDAQAQPQRSQQELISTVPRGQAARLEEYNSAFIQEQTFFASRYRIVQADIDLIRQASKITVTPFDDVISIELTLYEIDRSAEDTIFWNGRFDWDPQFRANGTPLFLTTIMASAWDLDESGTPLFSAQNRFEFSEQWDIDENGQPVQASSANAEVDTGPPQTQEQIERHARLKRLQKHAFFSVYAVFDVPGYDSKYVLEPLKHTPRYSVLYEIPRDTPLPIRNDFQLGDPQPSEAERQALDAFNALKETLPDEAGRSIVEDVR